MVIFTFVSRIIPDFCPAIHIQSKPMEASVTLKDRIKAVMQAKGIATALAFADSIGVSQATLSHILGTRGSLPSLDVLLRLNQRYPDINLNWLITGEGAMSAEIAQHYVLPPKPEPTSAPTLFDPIEPPKAETMPYQPVAEVHRREIAEIRVYFDDGTYEVYKR